MRIILDTPFSIAEICRITHARYKNKKNHIVPVNAICTDTRECQYGDLFIALSGERNTGEKYTDEALSKNCFILSSKNDDRFITVDNTNDALLEIASTYKEKINPKYTVAVTGSIGKSTTVKFLSKILAQKYNVHSTIDNFNNHIGVPLTILSMPQSTDILITELGMNHRHEISKLSKCVKPDLGIITVIGTSHIGNLGSREEIAAAKLEILDGMADGRILVPYEEPLLSKESHALYVGRNSSLSTFSLDDDMGRYSFKFNNNTVIDSIEIPNIPEHLIYNLSLAISTAYLLDLSKPEIINGVKAITASDLRQRFITLKDLTILDDSYNASIESISADLKFIKTLKKPTGAFIGDILELGENATKIHENIGRIAADLKINHLYLYGQYAQCTARGAVNNNMDPSNIYINTNLYSPEISIEHIIKNHSPDEIVLFKASRKLRLDKIADLIKTKKG